MNKIKPSIGTLIKATLLLGAIVSLFARSAGQPIAFAEMPELTYEDLVRIITVNKVRSIDDLLPFLPESFRARNALVYDSRSKQGASFENPRAILYGNDGSLVVTFNGDPSQEGYDKLEVMQYRDAKFEFREITFPVNKASSEVVQFSGPQPESCLGCHGNPPRPRWDPYYLWPGVYGSEEDHQPRKENSRYVDFLRRKPSHSRYKHLPNEAPALWAVGPEGFSKKSGPFGNMPKPNAEFNALLNRMNFRSIARELKEDPTRKSLRYALLGAMSCQTDLGGDVNQIESFIPDSLRSRMKTPFKVIAQNTRGAVRNNYLARIDRQRQRLETPPEQKRILARYDGEDLSGTLFAMRWLLENTGYPTENWSMVINRGGQSFNDGVGGFQQLEFFLWQELLDPVADRELYQLYKAAYERAANPGASNVSGGGAYDSYGISGTGSSGSYYTTQVNYRLPFGKGGLERIEVCKQLREKSLALLEREAHENSLAGSLNAAPACVPEAANEPVDSGRQSVLFSAIRRETTALAEPLQVCYACHAVFKDKEKLRTMLSETGYKRGTLAREILYRIEAFDEKEHAQLPVEQRKPLKDFERMPLGVDPLSPKEKELIRLYLKDLMEPKPAKGQENSAQQPGEKK